jgi:4-diphosphocytidyl-2-C-methyl-D-erythritol kinase
MLESLVAITPAKINLGLEITGRRPDGFHEVVTILQAISLFDRFTYQPSSSAFQYRSPPGISPETDLARRALLMSAHLSDATGLLTLEKGIPEAAGLGGGSSDAAAALRIGHRNACCERVVDVAGSLGSDVPFFLRAGTALATGTGSTLRQLTTPAAWVVLVTPRLLIPSKTRTLYSALGPADFTNGETVRNAADATSERSILEQQLPNAFTRPLLEFREVQAAIDGLRSAGAPWVSVSGAGPTVFTLVEHVADAASIARRVPDDAGSVRIARTLTADSGADGLHRIGQAIRAQSGSR